jgi:hypothetical protein
LDARPGKWELVARAVCPDSSASRPWAVVAKMATPKVVVQIGLDWLRFPNERPIPPGPYALFHTMVDMMTVFLRIDTTPNTNFFPRT